MNLKLQYAPTPERAPRHAELAVKAARELSQLDLDYSPASLYLVDDLIEDMRNDGVTAEQLAETLFAFGCYVGEVLVRHAGGRWRRAEETSMAATAGYLLVIELAPDSFCNPIAKVFKRLQNGTEDHLPYFYQVFTHQEVPQPARPGRKPWWKLW